MATTGSITSDVSSITNPVVSSGRKVSATVNGTDVQSNVDATGDQTLFADGTKQMGKQDFLQLLVTQMRYQDPLAPQDNQQFISQLAQFSALEGTQNINTSIAGLSTQLQSMVTGQTDSANTISNSSATSLIGKTVRVNAADVVFDPTKTTPININVHSDAGTNSVLTILDSNQKIVNALPLQAAGETQIQWNGQALDGTTVPAGNYTLKVTSTDGATDTGYTYFESTVSGISYSKTGTRVEVNGQAVAMDQILHVADATQ